MKTSRYKENVRSLREAKRKLENDKVEKVPKMRRIRQKLKGRIEYGSL